MTTHNALVIFGGLSITFACLAGAIVLWSIISAYLSGMVDGLWNNRLNIPRSRLGQSVYEWEFQRERRLSKERKLRDEQKSRERRERVRRYEERLEREGKL